MSINNLFAVLHCQPRTRNRLRGEARNGRRAIYVDRSRRPDGDLRDKPGCVPASGCTKGAPWRATRCIGADGSPVGGAQQRRPSPYLVSQEEKPSKSARGAGPPGKAKARSAIFGCIESDLPEPLVVAYRDSESHSQLLAHLTTSQRCYTLMTLLRTRSHALAAVWFRY